MIWTNVSGWPMLVVRMHLWKSSGCYAYACRVPLLGVVRIGEARHVLSWENSDEINPDKNVCHTSSGDVCHVWEGSLQAPMIMSLWGSYNIKCFSMMSMTNCHQNRSLYHLKQKWLYICFIIVEYFEQY